MMTLLLLIALTGIWIALVSLVVLFFRGVGIANRQPDPMQSDDPVPADVLAALRSRGEGAA
jgi:hypothetical protein